LGDGEFGVKVKVFFRLEQDADGYPPVTLESVWACKTQDNFYEIDNIPFYARGVSYRDCVDVERVDDVLYFKDIVRVSGHSTIRVIVFDHYDRQALLKDLENYGCSWESSHQSDLIAVDIPPEVNLSSILVYLQKGHEQGRWDYEEACIAE